MTKFSQVNFRKSNEILEQFDKSIKSYIKIFEAVDLLAPPASSLAQVVLKHIQAKWGIIKVYSGLFSHIQNPVFPSHIHNLSIFRALAYLEP